MSDSQYVLRAMARNYHETGHRWDHLDGEAVTKAADEIKQLKAEVERLTKESALLSGPEETVTVCQKGKPYSFMAKDPRRYALCEVTYARPVYELIEERDKLQQRVAELELQDCTAQTLPLIREKVCEAVYRLQSGRVWGGMSWGAPHIAPQRQQQVLQALEEADKLLSQFGEVR